MQRNPFNPESGSSFSLEDFQSLRAKRPLTLFTPDSSHPDVATQSRIELEEDQLDVDWSWANDTESLIKDLVYAEEDIDAIERLFNLVRYLKSLQHTTPEELKVYEGLADEIAAYEAQLGIYPAVGRELRRVLLDITGDSGLAVDM